MMLTSVRIQTENAGLQVPFRTADYGVAGYLLARGFTVLEIQRQGKQVIFCFDNTPKLVAAVGDYTSNKPVPCRDMFHGLRKAKALIQNHMRRPQNDPSSQDASVRANGS